MNHEDPPPSYGVVLSNPGAYPASYQTASCTAPLFDQAYTPQNGSSYGTYSSVHEVTMPSMTSIGRNPVTCTCPYCNSFVMTHVKYRAGLLVWICVLILIVVGCILGCCLIPFCVSSLKNARHYCPICRKLLGEYRPI